MPPVHFAVVILEMGGLTIYLPRLALNLSSPNFSLPSSQDYRHEPWAAGKTEILVPIKKTTAHFSWPTTIVLHEYDYSGYLRKVESHDICTFVTGLFHLA
jgi:hypothetical protein